MNDKAEQVKVYFDMPERYLAESANPANIRIRADAVGTFAGDGRLGAVLDIGCGDGSLSIPLLPRCTQLTLLDPSESMLSVASSRVPADLADRVQFVHSAFEQAQLGGSAFDLILCMGVLAHVNSPLDIVTGMVQRLSPDGRVILQNTDAKHPASRIFRRMLDRRRGQSAGYKVNQIGSDELLGLCRRNGLVLSRSYRYTLLPGMARLVSASQIRRMARMVFGQPAHGRMGWLGSECIYLLSKGEVR